MRFASEMSSAFVTSPIKCIGIYSKFFNERCCQSALEFGFTLTFAFSTGKCNRLKIGTYSSCVDSELSSFINLIIVSVYASI